KAGLTRKFSTPTVSLTTSGGPGGETKEENVGVPSSFFPSSSSYTTVSAAAKIFTKNN
ncbi:unnamed protein product, partial [Amoebophrya sp. A25]